MKLLEKLTTLEMEGKEFGFYWSDAQEIFNQIASECREIKEAFLNEGAGPHLQEEIGDLIHAAFSLCLFFGYEAEETLEKSVMKFEKRFKTMQTLVNQAGLSHLKDQPLSILLKFWQQAKRESVL